MAAQDAIALRHRTVELRTSTRCFRTDLGCSTVNVAVFGRILLLPPLSLG